MFDKKIELRLLSINNLQELREREDRVRNLRSDLLISPGLDSEHKRLYLEHCELFTPDEINGLAEATNEELCRSLSRIEMLLTINSAKSLKGDR
jgi:hypothetical protein